jgi:hypothetical protein
MSAVFLHAINGTFLPILTLVAHRSDQQGELAFFFGIYTSQIEIHLPREHFIDQCVLPGA